jgi:hypothetical protein
VDALPSDGERRLMLAVLIDAIRTLSAPHPAEARHHQYRTWLKELEWVQSDEHRYVFSFVNICGALGFDADYVRRHVLSLSMKRRPVRICRYAAKVGDSWQRQQRPSGAGNRFAKRNSVVAITGPLTIGLASPSEPVCAAGGM